MMIASLLFFTAALFLSGFFAVLVVRDGERVRAALAGDSVSALDEDAPFAVTLEWVKRPVAANFNRPQLRAVA